MSGEANDEIVVLSEEEQAALASVLQSTTDRAWRQRVTLLVAKLNELRGVDRVDPVGVVRRANTGAVAVRVEERRWVVVYWDGSTEVFTDPRSIPSWPVVFTPTDGVSS